MASEFVESNIREIIADQLGLSEDDIQPSASITADLGADVLDFLELIMAFEEEFEIEIDDEDAGELKTVGDVIAYVSSKT